MKPDTNDLLKLVLEESMRKTKENEPVKTVEEIEKRNKEIQDFAKKIISTWPAWKRAYTDWEYFWNEVE